MSPTSLNLEKTAKVRKPEDRPIVELMRWTFSVTNKFFSLLYSEGIFLPRECAEAAVELGFSVGDPWQAY